MPATAASSPAGPSPQLPPAGPVTKRSKHSGLAARVGGLWPVGLVTALLAGWVLWLGIVMTHPLHPTTPSALLDPVRDGSVERWAFVEPTNHHLDPLPALSDPMREEWAIADQDPPATAATQAAPASQSGWIAWKDDRGAHVAQLDGRSVTVTAQDGYGWSAHVETRDVWPTAAIALPRTGQVRDVADLWNGSRLLGPSWLLPAISFVLAVALLCREPRHRTRWGWFWMLGAPLGFGFVWMLLREQLFGARSNQGRRPGGWAGFFTAFLLGIPAQILLSGIVPRM